MTREIKRFGRSLSDPAIIGVVVRSVSGGSASSAASAASARKRRQDPARLNRQASQDDDDDESLDADVEDGQKLCQAGTPSKVQPRYNHPPSMGAVVTLLIGHTVSASCLLVINKWALSVFPYMWVLTTLQFLPAASIARIVGAVGAAEVNPFSRKKLVDFLPAAGMFFITMTAGNAVVQHSNVDTYIVMRSLVPIPCALLETFIMGEPCPRPASWMGLAVLLSGAVCYASVNQGVTSRSAGWMTMFLVIMPIDAVLIKDIISSSGLTQWGLVMYQNSLAAFIGILCILFLEFESLDDVRVALRKLKNPWTMLPVFLSCVFGTAVSYFQMSVRRFVSSTAYTVIGVSNKLLALLVNQLSMEANRSITSVSSVLFSICGAVLFQQTVKGNGLSHAPPKTRMQSTSKTLVLMIIGIAWSGWLNYLDHHSL